MYKKELYTSQGLKQNPAISMLVFGVPIVKNFSAQLSELIGNKLLIGIS